MNQMSRSGGSVPNIRDLPRESEEAQTREDGGPPCM